MPAAQASATVIDKNQ